MTSESTVKRKMMPGTSSAGSYFPFARNGDILLGVHLDHIWPGDRFGVPGTTYFTVRLRSAPSHGLFAEDDAKQKVVKFQKEPANLADAWPNVTWEKHDSSRASTTIGAFIPGRLDPNDDAATKVLLDNVGDGKLAIKLTDYLMNLAGPHMFIVEPKEMEDWLASQLDPIIARIKKAIAKQKELQTAFQGTVGSFGMAAAILKKTYGETEAGQSSDNDPEDNQDPEVSAQHLDEGDEYNEE